MWPHCDQGESEPLPRVQLGRWSWTGLQSKTAVHMNKLGEIHGEILVIKKSYILLVSKTEICKADWLIDHLKVCFSFRSSIIKILALHIFRDRTVGKVLSLSKFSQIEWRLREPSKICLYFQKKHSPQGYLRKGNMWDVHSLRTLCSSTFWSFLKRWLWITKTSTYWAWNIC